MATKHRTTQEPPVVLPVGLNAWLVDCVPAPGCKVCAANWRQVNAAKDEGDIAQAARHATEIRDHASGVH
ncbi:hypothetical protein ACFVJ4_32655 [Streptomyces sp. NPDC127178]|uniref:hypothetical protein n=1 Tax=unclassified Streptomyces TaxID=2593676 RepID=UPI003640C86C